MKLNAVFGLLVPLLLSACAHSSAVWEAEVERENRMEDRAAEWIYAEPVTYRENHDPFDIYLTDGRDLRVSYGTVTWQEVQGWKPGRKLTLAYSAMIGCALVDSETLAQLPVIGGWDNRHPLDLLLRQNLELACTTVDIVEAYDASVEHWQAETDRLYRLYLESGKVPADAKDAIRTEHATWEMFREAHALALDRFYSVPDGTMWEIKCNEEYHAFIRDQARRLQDMIEPIDHPPQPTHTE